MIKKLLLLSVATGSLIAFAAPALAHADELYEESGPLEVGAEVTLTSTDLRTVTPLGTMECESVTLHSEVTENGPTTISAKELLSSAEGCNKETTDLTASTINFNGGSGTIAWKFVTEGFCTVTGTIPFSYVTDTDVLTVTGKEQLTGSPSFPCGKLTMSASFTLETSDGTPVYVS